MNSLFKLADKQIVSEQIINAIPKVIGKNFAHLHEPQFEGNEWHYLKECLDIGFVSTVAQYLERFELKVVEYKDSKHSIALVNQTSALHLAMNVAGVKLVDDVLTPLSIPISARIA